MTQSYTVVPAVVCSVTTKNGTEHKLTFLSPVTPELLRECQDVVTAFYEGKVIRACRTLQGISDTIVIDAAKEIYKKCPSFFDSENMGEHPYLGYRIKTEEDLITCIQNHGVLHLYIDPVPPKMVAAYNTLKKMGYTYHGGELWKPPLGEAPDFVNRGKQSDRFYSESQKFKEDGYNLEKSK